MEIPLKQYWKLLQKYIIPQWKTAFLMAFFLLSNIGLRLVNPQIIRNFIDAAQSGAASDILIRSALLFLGLALGQQIVSVLASYVGEIVAWTATNALRVDLAHHCLKLDLSFHNTHTPGEMIERVDGDINNLANFFSRFVIELLGNAIFMVGILFMLWLENWLVGLGLSIFVIISLSIMLRYRNVAVPHWAAERQASANFYGFLEERLSGTEDIRANGVESYVLRQFHALIREMLRKSLKSAMVINVIININQFLFAVGIATAFGIGANLFQNQIITIGTVYLVYHYTSLMNHPMDDISHQIEQLQRAGAGIVRIQELLDIKSKISAWDKSFPPSPILADDPISGSSAIAKRSALTLRFEGVTFGYDDSIIENGSGAKQVNSLNALGKELVLHNLTFSLASGKILGLLGRTGSGKTTLTRLIFRFYDPDEGSVLIGSDESSKLTDIRKIPLKNLRSQVGMVTQNIQLFNASVRDNLTFFDSTVPDQQINDVITELGLNKWLRSLPAGLDTILEAGGGLSAGEAQLLAFTRIFLSDPGLIILDEASSRLDPATETLIERAVERLLKNRTAIIIAHRLGTIQKADEIMIMDQGHIEEHGERDALISDPFSKLNELLQKGLEEVLV